MNSPSDPRWLARAALVAGVLLMIAAPCYALDNGDPIDDGIWLDASRPDDNGNGYTPATAKKTLSAAKTLCTAGDTIYIVNGSYVAETWDKSGTAGRRITLIGNIASPGSVVFDDDLTLAASYVTAKGIGAKGGLEILGTQSAAVTADSIISCYGAAGMYLTSLTNSVVKDSWIGYGWNGSGGLTSAVTIESNGDTTGNDVGNPPWPASTNNAIIGNNFKLRGNGIPTDVWRMYLAYSGTYSGVRKVSKPFYGWTISGNVVRVTTLGTSCPDQSFDDVRGMRWMGLRGCTLTDNSFTVYDSAGGNCLPEVKRAMWWRDLVEWNHFNRDSLIALSGAQAIEVTNSGGEIGSPANNTYNDCLFKNLSSSLRVFSSQGNKNGVRLQGGTSGSKFNRCFFVLGDSAGGVEISTVSTSPSTFDHCTFITGSISKHALMVATDHDDGDGTASNQWTTMLNVTNNIFYTPQTANSSTAAPVKYGMHDANALLTADYNLFANWGGNRAKSIHLRVGNTSTYHPVGPTVSWTQDAHSVYGSPRFGGRAAGDSLATRFDHHIRTDSRAAGTGMSGSSIGAGCPGP